MVLIYVDDLIISRNHHGAIEQFKTYLSDYFHMKDLGVLKYFLGVEVARNPTVIFLCQRKCALDIILEVGLLGTKPANIPLEQNHKLALANGNLLVNLERYRWLVGHLIYLCFTRLELLHCIHNLLVYATTKGRTLGSCIMGGSLFKRKLWARHTTTT